LREEREEKRRKSQPSSSRSPIVHDATYAGRVSRQLPSHRPAPLTRANDRSLPFHVAFDPSLLLSLVYPCPPGLGSFRV
jgi:hypothetical protein